MDNPLDHSLNVDVKDTDVENTNMKDVPDAYVIIKRHSLFMRDFYDESLDDDIEIQSYITCLTSWIENKELTDTPLIRQALNKLCMPGDCDDCLKAGNWNKFINYMSLCDFWFTVDLMNYHNIHEMDTYKKLLYYADQHDIIKWIDTKQSNEYLIKTTVYNEMYSVQLGVYRDLWGIRTKSGDEMLIIKLLPYAYKEPRFKISDIITHKMYNLLHYINNHHIYETNLQSMASYIIDHDHAIIIVKIIEILIEKGQTSWKKYSDVITSLLIIDYDKYSYLKQYIKKIDVYGAVCSMFSLRMYSEKLVNNHLDEFRTTINNNKKKYLHVILLCADGLLNKLFDLIDTKNLGLSLVEKIFGFDIDGDNVRKHGHELYKLAPQILDNILDDVSILNLSRNKLSNLSMFPIAGKILSIMDAVDGVKNVSYAKQLLTTFDDKNIDLLQVVALMLNTHIENKSIVKFLSKHYANAVKGFCLSDDIEIFQVWFPQYWE